MSVQFKGDIEKNVVLIREEFLMNEACSLHYMFEGQVHEAQDIETFLSYMEHAEMCSLAARACSDFIQDKNKVKLISEFKKLGLTEFLEKLL